MADTEFRRARSSDAIEARREALLDAARKLMEDQAPLDISLAAICGQAGLVKSAVYRYFESREDVLIEVLQEDLREFLAVGVARINARDQNDFPGLAADFAELVAARPRMACLFSHLASILERNVSAARILEIKLEMRDIFTGFVQAMAAAAPALGPRVGDAALAMNAQVSAWYGASHPHAEVREALKHPELKMFQHDFKASLEMSCRAILIGLASEAAEADR